MDKNIAHAAIDGFFKKFFPDYTSKQGHNSEIDCSFKMDGRFVSTSIAYSTMKDRFINCDNVNDSPDALDEFSIPISQYNDINNFLIKINEENHVNLIDEITNFYDDAGVDVIFLLFKFSNTFNLIGVNICKTNLNLEDLKNPEITTDFLREKFLATYINKNSTLIQDVVEMELPHYKSDSEYRKNFIDKFKEKNIKQLYIEQNKSIKFAASQLTSVLKENHIDLRENIDDFKHLWLRTYTKIFNYKFEVISKYNQETNDFDIIFNVKFNLTKELEANAYQFLMQKSNNHMLFYTIKEIENNVKPLNLSLTDVSLYFSPNFIMKKVELNNHIVISQQDMKDNASIIDDILLVKFLNTYYKEILNAQHISLFNESLSGETILTWTEIIKEFNNHKKDLLMLVKMSTI